MNPVGVAAAGTAAMLGFGVNTAGIGSGSTPSAGTAWVHQIGTYGYLTSPDYDGLAPIRKAARGASMGLGTFNRLDGELVMLKSVVYRVGVDGKPHKVTGSRKTPFLQTAAFRPDRSRSLPKGTSCGDLEVAIDRLAGTSGGIVPVRLTGRFTELITRSVPRQSKPYPPLSEALEEQVTFDLGGRRAALVGFRTGPDLDGLSPVGLHLHGLTANHRAGGHVLSCRTGGQVRISVQTTNGVNVRAGG